MISRTQAWPLLVAACTLGACAGPQTPREDRLNQVFAQIQVHEANIERDQAELARVGSGDDNAQPEARQDDCSTRCAAVNAICQDTDRICELAREIADADALARCSQARSVCNAAQSKQAECSCASAR